MADPAPIDCPRCGWRALNPITLVCSCSAEFTVPGLAYWRALPAHQALRGLRQ
ncbi:hypothetical protein [Brevundimonas sp.]|uniref:hypothetical protein n=1 Tax=Brevundimonas sp. TaxID=1871086 RepID=UPI00257D5848|nr:hypothetical protein [Brevundimonas sp.]